MTNDDCLFCKIAAKKIPGYIIREDDATIAFLDIMPRTKGHTVVVSKYHTPTIMELPDEERNRLFNAVADVDKMLIAALSPDGVTIGMNQGAASGQEVAHLHVHLLPRWHSDGGGAIQSVVSRPPTEGLEDVKKQILG